MKNNQLIAFISVYFFYPDACELTLLVHPDHRRQGIARQLLRALFPRLEQPSIQYLIFSTLPDHYKDDLQRLGFTYEASEYQMCRMGSDCEPILTDRLVLRDAEIDNIPALLHLDSACFITQSYLSHSHYLHHLNHPNYHLLAAYYQGQLIGKAHIRRTETTCAYLSDIAILPDFQKQGLGRELLAKTIQTAIQTGISELHLDVATNNASNAVSLYLNHGFKVVSQHDFWRIPIEKLKEFILTRFLNDL